MSQENVELWREMLEEILAGSGEADWERWLTRVSKIVAPTIEWDASEVPVPGLTGVYRGREAVVRWWREWLAAWETVEFEYDLVDAGDDVVLLLDQRMRGRSTGIEVELGKYAQLATFKDGLIVRYKIFASQSKALAAAGLGE
jgi:hypothetical protein